MNIALIAHDQKKAEMVEFTQTYESVLAQHDLFTTGTTGLRIMEHTALQVTRMKSGPLGGDQEIGAMVANGKMDMVLFFRDPLSAQPHEPDINALIRLCDVYQIPLATNIETGKLLVQSIKEV